MYEKFKIDEKVEKLSMEVENELTDIFKNINKQCEINSMKVLNAFQEYNISEMHFGTSTGYGLSLIHI